jgi:hypothetical protein
MTKFKITATAPTSYQLGSLRNFGLNVKYYPTGSYIGEEVFDTEEEAKAFLKKRSEMFFDGNSDNDEERLSDALDRIEKHGSVYFDAVCGSIEEFEKE